MASVNYGFEYKVNVRPVEQTTQHGYTWQRMRDDVPLAMSVEGALRKVFDVSRIKLWMSTDREPAAIGVSMVDACADGLESLAEVVQARAPTYYTVLTWREEAATKTERQDAPTATQTLPAGWFFDDDGEIARRLAYECVGNDIHIEHVLRNGTTAEFAVIADTRAGKIHKIVEACWRDFGPNFSVYETLTLFAENIRKRVYDLSGVRMKVAERAQPKPTAQRPPTGYVYSREFGAGQVVCVNGNEVTIDTERGRKTFVWTPPHDRAATPSETSRVSATLAHRTALLCRERWATDGFGRPTAAFVEACGVVAATWVEHAGREALTVPDLLTHARLRMSLT